MSVFLESQVLFRYPKIIRYTKENHLLDSYPKKRRKKMKNKKQSRSNRTMREKLEALGMKMTPDDHPIYTMNLSSIRFVSKVSVSTKKEEDNE